VSTPEPPVPQPVATPAPLAEWATRALGFVIDYLPIILLNLLMFWSDALRYLAGLIGFAYWVYMGYLDGITGQTPGKAVAGTRVVTKDGQLMQAGLGIGRKFLHVVDALICGLGFLLPIVDSKRQTIADKLVDTYVVTGVEKKPFSVDLWMPPKPPATT
jgi:uncharacterized RDD family membrane protein YckC